MHRCGQCGSKDIELRSIKGTVWPYKDADLTFPENYEAETCMKCGNVMLWNTDIINVDKVLEQEYQKLK